MAAFEHPLTDPYLSLIHQSRIRASSPAGGLHDMPSSPSPTATASQPSGERRQSDHNPAADIIASSTPSPSTALATSTSLAASFEPLSSAQVLERVPSSVVRLVAALGPVISTANRLLRLATWTGGPGSGASSMLLVVGWWLTCAFGYEVIRYAPQAILLAFIAYTWIRRQLGAARPSRQTQKRVYDRHDVISATKVNATLLELSELVDFYAAIRQSVIVPAIHLLSWDPSPANTKAAAAFLLFSWPVWLIAFLPWDNFRLPIVVMPFSIAAAVKLMSDCAAATLDLAIKAVGPQNSAAIAQRLAPILAQKEALVSAVARTPLPSVYQAFSHALALVRLERYTDFSVRLLPPYPVAALSVRSMLCLGGTLALTWCSPWCGLIRQAIWKSSTIRRLVRGIGRILSGQRPFRDAWGRGKLDDELTRDALTENTLFRSSAVPADVAKKAPKTSSIPANGKISTAQASTDDAGFTRHEDVIYQFSIFENQRWWVGLDWTAALLPQERPSWSDESNNPVSPPSSFSLPPSRITLTPSPTAANPKAFQRRTVKWQWLDPEWTVAGTSHSSFPSTTSATFKGSAKDAAVLSAKSTGDSDAVAAAKQGYLGDALNRIRSARSLPASPATADKASSLSTSSASTLGDAGALTAHEEDDDWDVDADGWQYGDNAWEKMSKKAGLGRYTRRRKWVRRAVLIELVERGVDGPAPTSGEKAKRRDTGPAAAAVISGSTPNEDTGDDKPLYNGTSRVEVTSAATKTDSGQTLPGNSEAPRSTAVSDVSSVDAQAPDSSSLASPNAGRADIRSRLAKAAHS